MVKDHDISQVGPDRRGWPHIIVDGVEGKPAERILASARELKWQLIDVSYYHGVLPPALEVQGVITTRLPSDPFVKDLLARGCPVVRMGKLPNPKDHLVPAVMEDLNLLGRMAAEHFADRGFRHVAYRGVVPWSDARSMYEGLKTRAAELGMACHLLRVDAGVKVEGKTRLEGIEGRRAKTLAWLSEIPKPVGFLGYGDSMAIRICNWCAEAGINVPREVAVLGRGNNVFTCESALTTLSSFARDDLRIAETAVELLQQLIDGQTPDETTVMIPPNGVVVRESTDVLATHDPLVSRAMKFMWDHLSKNIGVDDIAREAGVSRRKLERAFREDLGRGINHELLRRRLERSCELLLNTDLPIAEIAPMLGFGSKDYFQRAFRKAVGVSPGRWRRNGEEHGHTDKHGPTRTNTDGHGPKSL
jgi:LacI family transcriptional regulator